MLANLMEISIDVIHFLQTQAGWMAPIMKFFTFLGNEEFYLLVMPILVWSIDYGAGIRLGVMLMVSGILNTYLKMSIRQPRPYWVSSKIENLIAPMGSFGLPSGHSQNAAAVFGLAAGYARNKWLKALVIFTIVMIAFSRLYLGVHSLADIGLGLLAGAALLWVFLKIENKVTELYRGLKPASKMLLTFGVSILLTATGFLIMAAFESPLPDTWLKNVMIAHPDEGIAPFSMDGLITSTATFFGLVSGAVWVKEQGGYDARSGKLWQHIVRFMIGIAGVLLIWQGLGMLFPRNADMLSYGLRYVRYTLAGLWISGLAPLVFQRAKLSE